jgi:hypothetical protein
VSNPRHFYNVALPVSTATKSLTIIKQKTYATSSEFVLRAARQLRRIVVELVVLVIKRTGEWIVKRGRILDAFVIETLGVLLVLWMLGVTFFFNQMPHPNGEAVADATAKSSQSTSGNSFLGTELSEAERREFTEQQLTLFGNAAKTLLLQVGKDAVNHVIQQVTATQPIAEPTATQTILEQLKQFPNWSEQGASNSVPTNAVPTNAVPTNAVPTNAVPTNAVPTNSVPTNSAPFNSLPTNQSPNNQTPTQTPTPTPNWQGSNSSNAQSQPVAQQPYDQQRVQQQPVLQQYFKPNSQPQPIFQQPVYRNHPYEQPVYQQPVGQPTYQQHIHPVYEQPVPTPSNSYYR